MEQERIESGKAFNVEVLKALINSYIKLLEPITPIGSKAVLNTTAFCVGTAKDDGAMVPVPCQLCPEVLSRDPSAIRIDALRAVLRMIEDIERATAERDEADASAMDAVQYIITDGNRFFRASPNHGDPGSSERWTSARCRATQYSSLEAMPSTIIGPKPDEDVLTATRETGGEGITYTKTEGDCIFCIAWSTEA